MKLLKKLCMAEGISGLEGNIKEKLPELEVLLISLLELGELCSCLVIKTCVLFCFLVELYVKLNESVDALALDLFTVAPALECNDLLTVLGTPVTEMIDADAVVSAELMEQFQGVTDYGRTQVSDMEGC